MISRCSYRVNTDEETVAIGVCESLFLCGWGDQFFLLETYHSTFQSLLVHCSRDRAPNKYILDIKVKVLVKTLNNFCGFLSTALVFSCWIQGLELTHPFYPPVAHVLPEILFQIGGCKPVDPLMGPKETFIQLKISFPTVYNMSRFEKKKFKLYRVRTNWWRHQFWSFPANWPWGKSCR